MRSAAAFEADALVHFRFTVSSCLSLVLPARVVNSERRRGARARPHVTRFQFALDQGEDDIDRIVSLLVEAATRSETVH